MEGPLASPRWGRLPRRLSRPGTVTRGSAHGLPDDGLPDDGQPDGRTDALAAARPAACPPPSQPADGQPAVAAKGVRPGAENARADPCSVRHTAPRSTSATSTRWRSSFWGINAVRPGRQSPPHLGNAEKTNGPGRWRVARVVPPRPPVTFSPPRSPPYPQVGGPRREAQMRPQLPSLV